MDYVCGFMFSECRGLVALIEKQKPAFLKGLWNGIGGKIEKGERSVDAMVREFYEETGVASTPTDWHLLCELRLLNTQASIKFFTCFSDRVLDVRTMEAEEVSVHELAFLNDLSLKENLNWLIPLALDSEAEYAFVRGNQVPRE